MKVKDLIKYLQEFSEYDEVHLLERDVCQGESFEDVRPLCPDDLSFTYRDGIFIIQIGQRR